MLDNSNLREPFDVTKMEDTLSTLDLGRGPIGTAATLTRLQLEANIRRTPTRFKDHTEMAESTGAEDASDIGESVEKLLAARENTHGSFLDNARVSQSIKRTMRAEPGWEMLTDVERESMDMIALKFSRILSGRPLERQHWEDVTGYAKLAEKQCD